MKGGISADRTVPAETIGLVRCVNMPRGMAGQLGMLRCNKYIMYYNIIATRGAFRPTFRAGK